MNSEEKFNELIKGCGKEAYFIEENEDLVLCGEDRTRKKNGEVIKFFCYECENKIKGFQEGLKIAIKIIDEEIIFLRDKIFNMCDEEVWNNADKKYMNCGDRIGFPDDYLFCEGCKWKQDIIEELKKQREQLQFEVELE